MAVYGYVRVSTTRQADEGLSLEVQRRWIEGKCIMEGWTLDKVYTERPVSGSRPLLQRPEGKALYDALQPGDRVIGAKLDRVFRSAFDALETVEKLKAQSVEFYLLDMPEGGLVTGNGLSKVFFTMLSAFAEFERNRIVERITEVKADQRARNRFLGGVAPYGYRVGDDGKLVLQPKADEAFAMAVACSDAGRSLMVISKMVSASYPDLGPVSHVTIQRVIKRTRGGKNAENVVPIKTQQEITPQN